MKKIFRIMGAGCFLLLVAACKKDDPWAVQGYVEGDYVHVAAPSGGRLTKINVERGTQVKQGAELYELDATAEKAAVAEAASRVEQARANLEDAKLGMRPSEIAAIEAELRDAQAVLKLAATEAARENALLAKGATPEQLAQQMEMQRQSAEQKVAQISARLETAKLGARPQQVLATEREVEARQAALTKAQWMLSEMTQEAPADGMVTDTVFRQGDWVPAGNSVIVMLPPDHLKVRAYVSQSVVGNIHIGDKAQVTVDGVETTFSGSVKFISPRAEYTPPVIYSKEMRSKFVFLVELGFPAEDLMKLHPGQPVSVKFSKAKD